jgi:hypothetical protein
VPLKLLTNKIKERKEEEIFTAQVKVRRGKLWKRWKVLRRDLRFILVRVRLAENYISGYCRYLIKFGELKFK